jgi:hypothetical protein
VITVSKNKNYLPQTIIEDRKKLIIAGLVSSMEILKAEFNFDEKQLNRFADLYTPALDKNLKGEKK